MRIKLGTCTAQFQPWRPESGRVFGSPYAFDCETTLIDDQRPWIAPAFVLGAAFDGRQGFFIQRDFVAAFLKAHRDLPIAFHNAPFDLAVIDTLAPDVQIYDWVDRDLVWDTRLLHRLFMLGTAGHASRGGGMSTLDACVQQHLGIELPKDLVDSEGDVVRLSYGKWLHRPPKAIAAVFLEYLAKDAIATHGLCCRLLASLIELLNTSRDCWGFVSDQWLYNQAARWGPQTHHIQLKGAITLAAVTANGLCVDSARRAELAVGLDRTISKLRSELRDYGYSPGGKGSNKALQAIMRRLRREHPRAQLPLTSTGAFATSREALEDLATSIPFLQTLIDYKAAQSLQSTFVNKMSQTRLHPSFDPLLVTGRTSSFGEINSQNLPRDDRVRECFVPSAGHVFINADYSTIELATLSQAVLVQLRTPSAMAGAINSGKDLHRLVASHVTGKNESDVTAAERSAAKAVNFGLPGGLSEASLKKYAKSNYQIELSDVEAKRLSDVWFGLFPEMRTFLSDHRDLGEAVATLFDLTPLSFLQYTGNRSFLGPPLSANPGHLPEGILGWMCLKVLTETNPRTRTGREYSADEIGFFWTQVHRKASSFPSKWSTVIANRQPSPELRRAASRAAELEAVFTLTGRLRANASFCARHNTVFQGVAADGAKLALWRLYREGYRVVNFIHDEVLVEVPEDSNLAEHGQRIADIMVEAMRELVPDVRIEVDYVASRCWSKRAERVFDEHGSLVPWTPAEEVSQRSSLEPTVATDTGMNAGGPQSPGFACSSRPAADMCL